MSKIDAELLLVDGENVSKLDIACIVGLCSKKMEKRIYQSEGAARKGGYPGFRHVVIPRVGKESVDKVIAMDAVAAWHKGVRKIAMMSNDKDYGSTAIHLKKRHPETEITIVCDETRVLERYLDEIKRHNIRVVVLPREDPLDDFACQVLEVIHELAHKENLSLSSLGEALRSRGVEYKRLKRDLIRHGVADPMETKGTSLELSRVAKAHLQRSKM